MNDVVAVISDIVDSRKLKDRGSAQRAILKAFHAAETMVFPVRTAWATFADEFQTIYPDVATACAATGLVRLLLPAGIDIRFGIARGQSVEVNEGDDDSVLDGSAWWRARTAIEDAEKFGGRLGTARTWIAASSEDDLRENASLLLRDHVITTMNPRERRITAFLIEGFTQVEIAEVEGVTQSAISQAARSSGALVISSVHDQWMRTQNKRSLKK